jgi:hypothetical protein
MKNTKPERVEALHKLLKTVLLAPSCCALSLCARGGCYVVRADRQPKERATAGARATTPRIRAST